MDEARGEAAYFAGHGFTDILYAVGITAAAYDHYDVVEGDHIVARWDKILGC